MIGPSRQTWLLLSLAGLILIFGRADGQQTPPPDAPNPYLMGTEGYDKGPRGLTSYIPIAIDRPFAHLMAADVAAKASVQRENPAPPEKPYYPGDPSAPSATIPPRTAIQS